MEPKNTKQEKVAKRSSLKTKLLIIGITTASLFTFTGCQKPTASIEAKNFNHQVFANEPTPKSFPAQLTSKVTLEENSARDIAKPERKCIKLITSRMNSWSKYHDTSRNLNKESWKETYDGKGVPLLRIAF